MVKEHAMNLVFDLGGVVFTWHPEQIIQQIFADSNARQRVRQDIFHHSDWVALDRGTLARDEAIQRAVLRTGLSKGDITTLMQKIPYLLVPIPQTIALIQRLKHDTVHKLFVLSNMHLASIQHIEQRYPVWDVFDGIVISCYIHLVKPELAIYQYLLEHYKLNPSETIFIDDSQTNVEAALKVGMQTIHFESPGQCERALEGIGCI